MDISSLKTPFVIVGAVATRLYMPQRLTQDLDLLVHVSSSDQIAEELIALGLSLETRLSVGGSHWKAEHGAELDVLELEDPWVQEAIKRPERAPDGSPVIALPYLVLLKMNASRGIDIGDLTRMLGLANEAARNRVRDVVSLYQPDDVEDLESLIALGDLEFDAERTAHARLGDR